MKLTVSADFNDNDELDMDKRYTKSVIVNTDEDLDNSLIAIGKGIRRIQKDHKKV